MNKNVNLIFSMIGFLTEIFYLINALHIWFRHITINFANIIDSIFKILIVIVGLILIIISMIFHKENYKFVNVTNYISIGILVLSTFFLLI